jgi:hypothetical protein
MRRAIHLTLTLLAGSALAGCDGTTPAEPATAGVSAGTSPQSREGVPFSESYEASGTIAPSPDCPAGTLQVTLTGGGIATHVGRYVIANTHCLDPATGAFAGGHFVKTAANGDQLFGTYGGIGTQVEAPQPIGRYAVDGRLTFTGGTGRFAGLTGEVTMRGIQVIDFSRSELPTQVSLTIEGTISNPGTGDSRP